MSRDAHFDVKAKPTLVIGNHKLEGKVVPEPKPLLVLRKISLAGHSDGVARGSPGEHQRHDEKASQPRVRYSVVGKITSKTIFKTRPKPLILKIGTSTPSSKR